MTKPTWDGERWSDDNPITDEEKHAYCMRRRGVCATFIGEFLYKEAERAGFDMRDFVITKPIPIPPGNVYDRDGKIIGSIMTEEQMKNQYRPLKPSDKPMWPCRGSVTKRGNP